MTQRLSSRAAAVTAGDELVRRILPDTNIDPCTQATRTASEDSIQGAYIPGPAVSPVIVQRGDGASVLNLRLIDRDVGDGRYPGQPGS